MYDIKARAAGYNATTVVDAEAYGGGIDHQSSQNAHVFLSSFSGNYAQVKAVDATAEGSYNADGTATVATTLHAYGGGLRTMADELQIGAAADNGGGFTGYGSPFSGNQAQVYDVTATASGYAATVYQGGGMTLPYQSIKAVGGGIDHRGATSATIIDRAFDNNLAYVKQVVGNASSGYAAGATAQVYQTIAAYGGGIYTLAETLQVGGAYPNDGSDTPIGFGSDFSGNKAYVYDVSGEATGYTALVNQGGGTTPPYQSIKAIGGGIDHRGGTSATIVDSDFADNYAYVQQVVGTASSGYAAGAAASVHQTIAAYGGGLYTLADTLQVGEVYYDGSDTPIGFGSDFTGNRAYVNDVTGTATGYSALVDQGDAIKAIGGGVDHRGMTSATIVDSDFADNYAYVRGVTGNAYSSSDPGATASVYQTIAAYGGGVYTLAETLQVGRAYPNDGSGTPIGFGSDFAYNKAYVDDVTGKAVAYTALVDQGGGMTPPYRSIKAVGGGIDHRGGTSATIVDSDFTYNYAYVSGVEAKALSSTTDADAAASVYQTIAAYGGGIHTLAETLQVGEVYYDGSDTPIGFGSDFAYNKAYVDDVIGKAVAYTALVDQGGGMTPPYQSIKAVGGGIDHRGGTSATIVDSDFTDNYVYVRGVTGNAFSSYDAGATATVYQTIAAYGGGVYTLAETLQVGRAYPNDGSGTPIGFGSDFTGNRAYVNDVTSRAAGYTALVDQSDAIKAIGGGIDHRGGTSATIIDSDFTDNYAYVSGVEAKALSSTTDADAAASVYQTIAAYGGGIHTLAETLQVGEVYYDVSDTPIGFGSDFSGNQAYVDDVLGKAVAFTALVDQGDAIKAIGGGIDHRGGTSATIIDSDFSDNYAYVSGVEAKALSSTTDAGAAATVYQTIAAYGGGIHTLAETLQVGEVYYDGSDTPIGFGSDFSGNRAYVYDVNGEATGSTATVDQGDPYQSIKAVGGGIDHRGTTSATIVDSGFTDNDAYVQQVVGNASSGYAAGAAASVYQTIAAYGGGIHTLAQTLQVGEVYYDGSDTPIGFGSDFSGNQAYVNDVTGTATGYSALVDQGDTIKAIGGGIDHRGMTSATIIDSDFSDNVAYVRDVTGEALSSTTDAGATASVYQTIAAYGGGLYTPADTLQVGEVYYDGSDTPIGFGSDFSGNQAYVDDVTGKAVGYAALVDQGAGMTAPYQSIKAVGGGIDHRGGTSATIVYSDFGDNHAYVSGVQAKALSSYDAGAAATVYQTVAAYGGGIHTLADTLQVGEVYYDGSDTPIGFGSDFTGNQAYVNDVLGKAVGYTALVDQGDTIKAIGGGVDHRGTTSASVIYSDFSDNDAYVQQVTGNAISSYGAGTRRVCTRRSRRTVVGSIPWRRRCRWARCTTTDRIRRSALAAISAATGRTWTT